MKILKNVHMKVLTVLLSIIILCMSLPISIFAIEIHINEDLCEENHLNENIQQDNIAQNHEETSCQTSFENAYELEDYREESVKQFRLEDGNVMAVQYATAVHRKDENGVWKNIDNTPYLKEDTLTTGDFRVTFSKQITDNQSLFTLKEKQYSISIDIPQAKKESCAEVEDIEEASENDIDFFEKLVNLEKISSKLIYRDILDAIDLEYHLVSNLVKENIIVKEKQEKYIYTFIMQLEHLEAEMQADGSIAIIDCETKEKVYYIPAPLVYDANQVYAQKEDAYYTLEKSDSIEDIHSYIFSIVVSKEYMNQEDRAYPQCH